MLEMPIPYRGNNAKKLRKSQREADHIAAMNVEILKLKGMGYDVYKSFSAGVNSLWSITLNGQGIGLCFESAYNAWSYLIIEHVDQFFFTPKL